MKRTCDSPPLSQQEKALSLTQSDPSIEIQVYTNSNDSCSKYVMIHVESLLKDIEPLFSRNDFRIVEIPSDKNQDLLERMRICALPTIMVGKQQIVGIPSARTLSKVIERASS